jgi:hypothetical protein
MCYSFKIIKVYLDNKCIYLFMLCVDINKGTIKDSPVLLICSYTTHPEMNF